MQEVAEAAKPGFSLRRVNNVLTVIVAALALYIALAPVLPEATWWWHHLWSRDNQAIVQVLKNDKPSKPIPKDNRLVVPRLDMNELINTGTSMYAELAKGVWLIPNTSTPDKGSNTVMAGHRFTYTNPRGVFYYLDKLQLDDRVTVDWQGKEYTYKVAAIKVVPPTEVSVQDGTPNSMVTLYTCTPLWSPHDRLVVQANLVGERS
jgi:LPXTG-site transpeptidase (sortase) family protein